MIENKFEIKNFVEMRKVLVKKNLSLEKNKNFKTNFSELFK